MSDIKDSSKNDDDGTDEGKGKKCTQIKKFVEMRLYLEVLFISEQKRASIHFKQIQFAWVYFTLYFARGKMHETMVETSLSEERP